MSLVRGMELVWIVFAPVMQSILEKHVVSKSVQIIVAVRENVTWKFTSVAVTKVSKVEITTNFVVINSL